MIGCPLENHPGHKNRDTPLLQHRFSTLELDSMSLTVIKSNSLYPFKARQRPCKARCGILAARKKDHGRALTCGTHFIHFSHNVFALNKNCLFHTTEAPPLDSEPSDTRERVALRAI